MHPSFPIKKTLSLRQFKNKIAAGLLICSVAWWPIAVLAVTTSTAIVTTNSVINFGSFSVLPSCANCSITISPAGVRTATAGIVLTSAIPGRAAAYSVTATCTKSTCTAYTAAVSPTSASLPAGSVTMTVGTFTLQQSATLPPNTLRVGATLTIPGSGTAGTYNGAAFTVTTTP